MTFSDLKCFLFLIYATFMLIYLSWLVFSKAMGIGPSTYLNGSPCPFLEARLSSVPLTKWCLHLPNCSARHLQALPDHILWPAVTGTPSLPFPASSTVVTANVSTSTTTLLTHPESFFLILPESLPNFCPYSEDSLVVPVKQLYITVQSPSIDVTVWVLTLPFPQRALPWPATL